MDVAVVEDVLMKVQVVEALHGTHAGISPAASSSSFLQAMHLAQGIMAAPSIANTGLGSPQNLLEMLIPSNGC